MQAYGLIGKILAKIKEAQTPPRFTNDFIATKLGLKTSSARPFITFAKRLGLLNPDGTPTELYNAFRSHSESITGAAMAEAIRHGYSQLYEVNEYTHDLQNKDLEGLIIQVTGLESKSKMVKNIAASFSALKAYADFTAGLGDSMDREDVDEPAPSPPATDRASALGFGLSYQINLILPKTDDIAVFNAIFRSLKENLLP